MGFQVDIQRPEGHQAVCTSFGCHWRGPIRSMVQAAEHDADRHLKAHYDNWVNYTKAIEEGNPAEYDVNITCP